MTQKYTQKYTQKIMLNCSQEEHQVKMQKMFTFQESSLIIILFQKTLRESKSEDARKVAAQVVGKVMLGLSYDDSVKIKRGLEALGIEADTMTPEEYEASNEREAKAIITDIMRGIKDG